MYWSLQTLLQKLVPKQGPGYLLGNLLVCCFLLDGYSINTNLEGTKPVEIVEGQWWKIKPSMKVKAAAGTMPGKHKPGSESKDNGRAARNAKNRPMLKLTLWHQKHHQRSAPRRLWWPTVITNPQRMKRSVTQEELMKLMHMSIYRNSAKLISQWVHRWFNLDVY
jgi:hypothetical protein